MKLEALSQASPADMTSLNGRLETLAGKLQDREGQLDNMSSQIGTLKDNVKTLESWIINVVQNLQGKFLSCIG